VSVIRRIQVELAIAISKIVRVPSSIIVVIESIILVSNLLLGTVNNPLSIVRVFFGQLKDHSFHLVDATFAVY
jgi:hypothetical protein